MNNFIADLVDVLQTALEVPVIKANQTGTKMPKYPFLSFTITTPLVANNGGWHDDGTEKGKPFDQTWSFTAQSDNDTEALGLAIRTYEFLDRVNPVLDEKGIVVRRMYDITNRDNFLTIQYEHRYGFDVTFAFMKLATNIVPETELAEIKIELEDN